MILSLHVDGDPAEAGHPAPRLVVAAAAGEQPAGPRLNADDAGEESALPGRPVSRCIGEKGVASQQPQTGGNRAAVQGMMVDDGNVRLVADLPAALPGAAAQV